jgi:hypothetical protein
MPNQVIRDVCLPLADIAGFISGPGLIPRRTPFGIVGGCVESSAGFLVYVTGGFCLVSDGHDQGYTRFVGGGLGSPTLGASMGALVSNATRIQDLAIPSDCFGATINLPGWLPAVAGDLCINVQPGEPILWTLYLGLGFGRGPSLEGHWLGVVTVVQPLAADHWLAVTTRLLTNWALPDQPHESLQ